MDPIFSSEYTAWRRHTTRVVGSNDPERKGCVSSDHQAHDQSNQRLRAIYLERLREAVRDKASRELNATPRDLAGSSTTKPSSDVCDKVELVRLSSPRGASMEDNDRRRVARRGSLERAVSWKSNLVAVCIIPSRHDAEV
jgi:hypothetical protein